MTKIDEQEPKLPAEQHAHREESLERLQHWYAETSNPLYAWEAINYCLDEDFPRPIPPWCEKYIRRSAINIFLLSRLADFRKENPQGGELNDKQASAMINEALGISSKGSANAFKCLAKDLRDSRDALTEYYSGRAAAEQSGAARNVQPDRLGRLCSRGLRLLRLSRAKPRR